MAVESLLESRLAASKKLTDELLAQEAPLLAAYWEFREELDRWTLNLVPTSDNEEKELIGATVDLLVQHPYRTAFPLSDPSIDSRQIPRAKALGAYIRLQPYIGRRFDTTFTDGEYFTSVVPVYFRPDLMTHLSVA